MIHEIPAPGTHLALTMQGSVGGIEARWSAPAGPAKGLALVCHPHPLMGGTMDNKVVYTLAACATKSGMLAMRFNFRGAGQTAGQHDHGRGEADDVVLLANALRERCPGLPLVLMGFSFGAWVSLCAAHRVAPQGLVSVAPPFGKYGGTASSPLPPGCPWRVLHSKDDEVVNYIETRDALSRYTPPPDLVTVDGAGHFFHSRLADIQNAVLPFLAQL